MARVCQFRDQFCLSELAEADLEIALEQSGFVFGTGPGFVVPGCDVIFRDHVEVIAGESTYDSLRSAVNRADGTPPWRRVKGTVKDSKGNPVAGALVHLESESGEYLSRTRSGANGDFDIGVPDEKTKLTVQPKGYPPSLQLDLAASSNKADFKLPSTATLKVQALEAGTGAALPVRIQVVPKTPPSSVPKAFGFLPEQNGRSHVVFAMDGKAELSVSPGEHRLVVTPGSRVLPFRTKLYRDRERRRGCTYSAQSTSRQYRLDVCGLPHPFLVFSRLKRHPRVQGALCHRRWARNPDL